MARTVHRFDAWRRRFVRRLLSFFFLLQLPTALWLARSIAARLRSGTLTSALLAGCLCALCTAPVVWRLFHWSDQERAPAWRTWLLELPSHAWLLHALFAAPLHGLVAVASLWCPYATAAGVAEGTAALLALWAVGPRRTRWKLRSLEVPLAGLPPELDGLRVAHLSDLHVGPYFCGDRLARLSRAVAELGPELVLVTGDLLTEGHGYLDELERFCAGLRAPEGAFACLGNHDYYGVGPDTVAELLSRSGVRPLRNERFTLRPRGGARSLVLAGIDDRASGRSALAQTLEGLLPGDPCVLLAHDPSDFDEALGCTAPLLMLSGHTHHGQLALPFVADRWNLARLRYRRAGGLFREGIHTLFVHSGLGTSGPPARFGAAPELVLLTLRAAPALTSSP